MDEPVTLALAGVPFADLSMNPAQALIHLLSDPNIAFILLTLGFYGLLFELLNPNFVTGVLGGIALILAFIGFGSLPLNVAGVLLIGLAMCSSCSRRPSRATGCSGRRPDLFRAGRVHAVHRAEHPVGTRRVGRLPIIAMMVAVTAAYLALVLFIVTRVRAYAGVRGCVRGGRLAGRPVGTTGVAKTPLSPVGVVYAVGEDWTARSEHGHEIAKGDPVRVVGQEDLTLVVESGPAGQPEPG